MPEDISLGAEEARAFAWRACGAVGVSEASTRALVDATMPAALLGPPTLENRIRCEELP
jgi:hypothetical protein